MIDWLADFEGSIGGHELIKRLKELKFHGKVEINFNEGRPLAANVHMFCKPRTQISMTRIQVISLGDG